MTALRSFSLIVLALSLGVGVASAQSLAELARKEKERREKNDVEAERVITDRELASTYGGLPTTSRSTSTSSSTSAEGAEDEEGTPESDEGEGAQDETQTREYWQNRVRGTKERIATLEEQLSSDDWGEGQRMGVDPRGVNNLSQRQKVEQDLAAARAELAAIQEEARRSGVPPGWVR